MITILYQNLIEGYTKNGNVRMKLAQDLILKVPQDWAQTLSEYLAREIYVAVKNFFGLGNVKGSNN